MYLEKTITVRLHPEVERCKEEAIKDVKSAPGDWE
jgi:hypothetical protein